MKEAKSVAVIVAGIFIAGLIMNQFRDIDLVMQAIKGYDA